MQLWMRAARGVEDVCVIRLLVECATGAGGITRASVPLSEVK